MYIATVKEVHAFTNIKFHFHHLLSECSNMYVVTPPVSHAYILCITYSQQQLQ